MEEWKEYKLGELCNTISDTYKRGAKEVVLINTSDVLEGKCLNHVRVPNENLKGQFKKTFQYNDILYSEIRPANKRFAFVDFDATDYIASTKLMVLRHNDKITPQYLYYILKSQNVIEELQMLAESRSGTFPQITFSELSNLKVWLPNKKTQNKIISILSSLDDKIEVNRRINEQLEELAQALFKSWFVDFEPFKDGEFVESELGMIPEGWKVETLGELCDSISKKHSFKKDKLIFLNTGDIHNNIYLHNNYMLVKDMPGQAKKTIEKGDILYSEIRPVNRHFALVNFDSTDYVVSTKLMVIRSRNINNLRLFQYLTSKDVVDFLQQEAETRSGTFPQIRFENIQRLKMIIASNDVETKYASLLSSIYSRMENNNKEITHLTNLRDTLLPKLMSGEIDVNEVEI